MKLLKKALKKIYFNYENGLVFCDSPPKDCYIGEIYHIEEKARKLGATAVFFRRKYNEKNEILDSKPVLYIYIEDNGFIINSEDHKHLHSKLWSAGEIDLYFVVSNTNINIFNVRKAAEIKDFNKKEIDLQSLLLVSEALEKFNDQRFSAIVFKTGTFWEQDDFLYAEKDERFFQNRLEKKNNPFHTLLDHLMTVRELLYRKEAELLIETETIDKILVICLLVKFLEEIRDDNGKHTLREIYKKHKIKDFAHGLAAGKCIDVLKDLSVEFNGKIFNNFSDEEKENIKKADLKLIADFLNADIDITGRQLFLWKQYSFKHLPPELISSVYENFLQNKVGDVLRNKTNKSKEKGIVYTPPFLVKFLVDEVMPLDKAAELFSKNQFKVLDPACGSGVFLVSAYKRMLQWWAINNYKKTNKIEFPSKETCQQILKDNIFGIDINSTAVLISAFSLTVALLDKLEPKEIWNNLRLRSLKDRNIKKKDFFEWANENKDKKFDLVIGNPPFNPISKVKKKEAVSDTKIELFSIKGKDIPDNNFAMKFFEGAMFFGRRICMIVPSNVFLYTNSKKAYIYRKRIFTQRTIEKIFDFTHLRRELFGSAEVSVCSVIGNSTASKGESIEHTVIKRVSCVEKKVAFEIDHYDRHVVPFSRAIDNKKQFLWKTNLLGGGSLFNLIYRFSLLPTLKDFIKKKKWEKVKAIKDTQPKIENYYDKIKGITEDGTPEIERDVSIDQLDSLFYFKNKPPFMIISQVAGEKGLPVFFVHKKDNISEKKYIYYKRNFIGISVPEKDEDELKNIFKFIKCPKDSNQLDFSFYVLALSGSALILTETYLNKPDILSIPYLTENKEYFQLSESEKILQEDILNYYVHLGKAISEKGEGRLLHEKANKDHIKAFGETFCNALNQIYAKDGKSWQYGKFYQTKSFTIFQLGYGKDNSLSFEYVNMPDHQIIKKLIYDNIANKAAVFTRVARIYKNLNGFDCVFLIKPHAVRYWLRSIALRDADETFTDLMNAGL